MKKELKAAEARDVDIVIFSFSRIKKPIGTTISYDLDEEDLNEIWKPKVVLVVDNKLTIMGSSSQQNSLAIWASNPAITKIRFRLYHSGYNSGWTASWYRRQPNCEKHHAKR